MNETQKLLVVDLRDFLTTICSNHEEFTYVAGVVESYLNEIEEAEHGPQPATPA